jgi:hypothetical protein
MQADCTNPTCSLDELRFWHASRVREYEQLRERTRAVLTRAQTLLTQSRAAAAEWHQTLAVIAVQTRPRGV